MSESGRHSRNGFLCSKGLKEAAQREADLWDTPLTQATMFDRFDNRVSVSGLRRDEECHVWDEELIDEQFRRDSNGS